MSERKRFGERLSRYFAGLSFAQRQAAAILVIVIVATAIWFGGGGGAGGAGRSRRGAGAAAPMEPLLDQSFNDADANSITQRLTARAVPHEFRAGKIYVPADKKLDALSDLFYNAVLSGSGAGGANAGGDVGLDTFAREPSAFDPPSTTDRLFNLARQKTCERVISRFRGVRKATVVIDPTNERHISGSILPVAMVDIQTQAATDAPGDPTRDAMRDATSDATRDSTRIATLAAANARQLASAAINVLTGVVAQLTRDRVRVTIDGATYNVGGGGDSGDAGDAVAAEDLLARKQQCEQIYVAKVRQLLAYIPDVIVSVSVDVDAQPAEQASQVGDSAKLSKDEPPAQAAIAVPEGNSERNPDTAIGEAIATAATVVANAVPMVADHADPAPAPKAAAPAAAVAPAAAPETAAPAPRTRDIVQKSHAPPAKQMPRSASVVVPRSYFTAMYLRANRKHQEPDDALLQPVIDLHAARIRALVKNALGLERDSDVSVEPYDDAASTASMTIAASPASPPGIAGSPAPSASASAALPASAGVWASTPLAAALNSHAHQIALAVLAMATALAVSVILRRRPIPALAAGTVAVERAGVLSGTLETAPSSASSQANTSDVAPEEAEAHRMFRRVRDVVTDNPDDAARVLREWIYQGR